MLSLNNTTQLHPPSFLPLTRRKLLDHLLFVALLALALLPLTRLPFGGGRGVNVEAPLWIIIFIFLIARLLVTKPSGTALPFFFMAAMFFIYSVFSIMILDLSISAVIGHLQLYFPFIIANLFLWTGFSIDPHRLLYGLAIAIALSALASLYIFYFAPQVLLLTYSDQYERYSAIINWGRNYFWRSGDAVYFSWMAVLLYKRPSKGFGFLLVLSLTIGVVGLVSTFARTQIVAFIFFVLVSFIVINPRLLKSVSVRSLGVMLTLGMLGNVYFSINPKIPLLFESRIAKVITQGAGSLTYSDISIRQTNYNEYLERFVNHPVFGQGFGEPYSVHPAISFYTDVALISFMLPFGLFGLFCFGLFIYALYNSLAKVKHPDFRNLSRIGLLLIFLSFLVSFNDNVLVYKSFVIYLAALIASVVWNDALYRKSLNRQKIVGILR